MRLTEQVVRRLYGWHGSVGFLWRDEGAVTRARAEFVVARSLLAWPMGLVRDGALVVGDHKVLGRVAAQLHRLPKLLQLPRLPLSRRQWVAFRRHSGRALATSDQVQPSLRFLDAQPRRTAVKVPSILAPEIGTLAQKIFDGAIDTDELPQDFEGERVGSSVVGARRAEPSPLEHVLRIQTLLPGVRIEIVLNPGRVIDYLVCPASEHRPAYVQEVVEIAVASCMRTVISGLRCQKPRGLAYPHDVVDGRGVIDVVPASVIQPASVMCKQSNALPEVAVHLLAVAGFPFVNILHRVVHGLAGDGVVCQPRAKGMKVQVGRVEVFIAGVVDLRRSHKERRRPELTFQVSTEPTGHRASIGFAGDVRIGRICQVLLVLTILLCPTDWHSFPLVTMLSERLLSAAVQVPWA